MWAPIDVWWAYGHGHTPSHREASATPRMIEQSMSVLQAAALPIGAAS
jgi:hypothetical protein